MEACFVDLPNDGTDKLSMQQAPVTVAQIYTTSTGEEVTHPTYDR